MSSEEDKAQARHKKKMENYKAKVDAKIAAANEERGIVIVITGNGKGKTTAGFGNVLRCIGHGYQAGVVQFIKGNWDAGETGYLRDNVPGLQLATMDTGFTWETQNKEADRKAAQETWEKAKPMLQNPDLKIVLLDEITYMFSFDYLDIDEVIEAIQQRPEDQTVIITGRNAKQKLIELADTVSEVKEIKHAFNAGIKAQKGIDW